MTLPDTRSTSAEALLQLHDRAAFEAPLPRILLAGAGTAMLLTLFPFPAVFVSLTVLAAAVLSVTAFMGDRLDRVLLSLPALSLPAFSWLPANPTWQLALAGACAGLLWIQGERCRLRYEVPLSPPLPGAMHFLASAAATAGLTVWGTWVGAGLAGALTAGGAPVRLAAVTAGITLALFVALGRLVAHVGRQEDPLLTRVRQLLSQLPADASALVQRARCAHEAAQAVLADLEDASTRDTWARGLHRAMQSLVDRAVDLTRLPSPDGTLCRRQRLEREALAQRLARTDDPLTRIQLGQALEAMEHEARGREALHLARERTLAQLHAGAALMEQGQLALQRTRHALASERADALASASRHLRALAALDPGPAIATDAPVDAWRSHEAMGSTDAPDPLVAAETASVPPTPLPTPSRTSG